MQRHNGKGQDGDSDTSDSKAAFISPKAIVALIKAGKVTKGGMPEMIRQYIIARAEMAERHGGSYYARNSTIADDLGVSEKQVENAVALSCGIVSRNGNGRGRGENKFFIVTPLVSGAVEDESPLETRVDAPRNQGSRPQEPGLTPLKSRVATGDEVLKEVIEGSNEEEGGRPTASRKTSSSSAIADKIEEKRPRAAKAARPGAPLTEEAAKAAVAAALGGRSILTPMGLVDAFAALRAACGRDYPVTERDEKVAPQVLKGVQSGPEDFAAFLAALAAKGGLPPYLSGLSELWAAHSQAAALAAKAEEEERIRALQAAKDAQRAAERLRWLAACQDPIVRRIAAVAAGIPEAERAEVANCLHECRLSRRASLLGEPVAEAAEAHGAREGLKEVVERTFLAVIYEHEDRQEAAFKAAKEAEKARVEAKANTWQADWDRRQAEKAAQAKGASAA